MPSFCFVPTGGARAYKLSFARKRPSTDDDDADDIQDDDATVQFNIETEAKEMDFLVVRLNYDNNFENGIQFMQQ